MARAMFSSGSLARALVQHAGASHVQLRLAGGYCSLWSEQHTNGLPYEGQWQGRTRLALPVLREALASVEDQPITLDLHWEGPGKLYALEQLPGGLGSVEILLPA